MNGVLVHSENFARSGHVGFLEPGSGNTPEHSGIANVLPLARTHGLVTHAGVNREAGAVLRLGLQVRCAPAPRDERASLWQSGFLTIPRSRDTPDTGSAQAVQRSRWKQEMPAAKCRRP